MHFFCLTDLEIHSRKENAFCPAVVEIIDFN